VNGWIAYVRPDLWILCVLEMGNCNIQITDPSFTVRFTNSVDTVRVTDKAFFQFHASYLLHVVFHLIYPDITRI